MIDHPARRAADALTRRAVLLGGAAFAFASCAAETVATADSTSLERARRVLDGALTIDMHSHAGRILRSGAGNDPVAAPMREGGMAVICLAMVADSPVTRVAPNGSISAVRAPAPGELFGWSRTAFDRIDALIEHDGLGVVTDRAALARASAQAPAVIVAAEGADFLDRDLARLETVYRERKLRHLQLTHYRVNTLGDIQTEPHEHGGLSPFGAEVIRECNRLGIVVDVAHGPYELVQRAVEVASKPLVLSHTSITAQPGPRSRQIGAAHARLIAGTGGVVGVWPNKAIYGTLTAMATGIARMVDAAGIDHVGLGSDMLGLPRGSLLDGYRDLPLLADALLAQGFSPEEARKILGGNYARVFAAVVG
jgi:membrane dipeptidase